MIELAKIRTDGGTQSRAAINAETVAEYAEAMRQPETVFPPVIVYYDGKAYWLADGFHRVEAWREVGRIEVPAEVRQGDRRRAILHSCGANAAHGLRRTNADKRRAVMVLLDDDEWSQWSARQIAKQCGVSPDFVARMKREQEPEVSSDDTLGGDASSQPDTKSEPDQETPPTPADGAATPDAVAEGTSGGGCGPAPAPKPEDQRAVERPADHPEPGCPDPYAEQRKKLGKFTREGLEDELIEARIALADKDEKLKAETEKRRAADKELKALKADYKEMAESTDLGPQISALKSRIAKLDGARKDERAKSARLQRRVNAQDDEIKKLRKEIEGQEVAL